MSDNQGGQEHPTSHLTGQAIASGCSELLTRLAIAVLLVLGIFVIASFAVPAAVLGTLSTVVAVWGYRRRGSLGWGWVLLPAALGVLWWGAAIYQLNAEPEVVYRDGTVYRATPVAPRM